MQKNSLEKKTFLIAGGSKGIGLAITEQLLAADATVHVYSRTEGGLTKSDRLIHHTCDFSDSSFETVEIPARIDGVVYCPGSINLRSFRSLKLVDFQNDFEINVVGAVKFLKGSLEGLKKGGGEHPTSVVLFSTVAAGQGFPMHSSIAAAKGAIEGLTRTLAAELAPKTRVNCLAPALTDTPLAANFFSSTEKRLAMDKTYPLGRAGVPSDLAAMAVFLLGPKSGWITGQVIGVDGGMSTIHR